MMAAFVRRTSIALLLLAIVCAVAWLYAPHRHFAGVLAVCYGCMIGWLAAWYSVYRDSQRHSV
jgi:cbb3-type cytochrome oxidase subunit 3